MSIARFEGLAVAFGHSGVSPSMNSSPHQLAHVTGRRVCVRLDGVLSRRSIDGVRSQLDPLLEGLPADGEILLDLTEVTRCSIDACRALALMQRRIGSRGLRTVYLTSRSRIHGAAWWIVHASRDQHAMPVSDMGMAERWFASSAERVDDLLTHSARAVDRVSWRYRQEVD
ncbi:MAG: STAS domain-containing protein [Myxococcota bacterium]